MFSRFERLIFPYPEQAPERPPRGLLPFVWACTRGLRSHVAIIVVLVAAVGAFEALLFGMLGSVVDWLGHVQPQRLWADEGPTLLLLAGALVASSSSGGPSSAPRRCESTRPSSEEHTPE